MVSISRVALQGSQKLKKNSHTHTHTQKRNDDENAPRRPRPRRSFRLAAAVGSTADQVESSRMNLEKIGREREREREKKKREKEMQPRLGRDVLHLLGFGQLMKRCRPDGRNSSLNLSMRSLSATMKR